MIKPTNQTIEIDEDLLAEGLSFKEAILLVNAILGYHGVKVFKDVADDVIGEFHVEE